MIKKLTYNRYTECFASLLKYATEYDLHILKLTQLINQEMTSNFNILDIGAGTGHFINKVLKKVNRLPKNYTAIEPSADRMKSLIKNMNECQFNKNFINEKFTPDTRLDKKYHLILMSHCLYWFTPSPEEYLINAFNLLEPSGKLVIYIQTPVCFSIMHSFFEKNLPSDLLLNHSLHCWDICDILEKHKLNYEISYFPGGIRVEDIINDSNNTDLKNILSFILLVEFDSLDDLLKERVIKFFEFCCCKNNNNVIFNGPGATIEIIK